MNANIPFLRYYIEKVMVSENGLVSMTRIPILWKTKIANALYMNELLKQN